MGIVDGFFLIFFLQKAATLCLLTPAGVFGVFGVVVEAVVATRLAFAIGCALHLLIDNSLFCLTVFGWEICF